MEQSSLISMDEEDIENQEERGKRKIVILKKSLKRTKRQMTKKKLYSLFAPEVLESNAIYAICSHGLCFKDKTLVLKLLFI